MTQLVDVLSNEKNENDKKQSEAIESLKFEIRIKDEMIEQLKKVHLLS